MVTIYLAVNALAYLGFAAWCTILPDKTSSAIGFDLTNASAKSEYITVYGGLELGMALFFLVAAINPQMRAAGILFALLLYGCLALFRLGTLLALDDVGKFPYAMFSIEVPMALLAAWLWFRGDLAAA